jgi:hypothetical protein
MVTTLSELVAITQGTAVPAWLRNEVLEKKNEIVEVLCSTGKYTLAGPNGEQVVIHADKQSGVAK